MGKLGRGWAMARTSFSVLKRYPRLVVFPLISGGIFLLVAGLIVASLLPRLGRLHAVAGPFWDWLGPDSVAHPLFYVAIAVVLYVLIATGVFFNVALIHCAFDCHAGREPSLGGGVNAAAGCLPQILGWALVAATVGMLLNALESFLEDKLGIFGTLLGGLLEFGWSAVTYFVLPVLAAERLGPIAALRRSSEILREKWGESLAGEARFSLLVFLFVLQAAALFAGGLAIVLSDHPGAFAPFGPLLIALGILYAIATMVVFQTLSTIFQAGVYVYATTGQVPASLDAELVTTAFRPKG